MTHTPRRAARSRLRLRAVVGGTAAALALPAAALTTPVAAAPSAEEAEPQVRRQMTEPFRVATFNILGASHTESSRSRFDRYRPRMRRTIRVIEKHKFTIVGLQEYQIPQHEMFLRRTDGRWRVWPGLKLGRRPVQNSIAWRSAHWRKVDQGTYAIPYFRGKMVDQPYLKLRQRSTGAAVWVINTHNVSNSKGPAQRWRNQAIDIQARLVKRLLRSGTPVLLVGDFNDRARAFCRLTRQAPLKAANGGRWDGDRCIPPDRMRIDWIFMSRAVKRHFYRDLDTPLTRSITDHKVIFADVSIPR